MSLVNGIVCRFCIGGGASRTRAYRSPTCAGVEWSEVELIVTTSVPSGAIMRDVDPSADGVSEAQVCCSFGGSADIVVDAYLRPKEDLSSIAMPTGDAPLMSLRMTESEPSSHIGEMYLTLRLRAIHFRI